MKRFLGYLLVVNLLGFLIAGCVTPGKYNTALDDIHADLQSSEIQDQKVAMRSMPRAQPPSAVSDALMPTMGLNLPANTAANTVEPRFNVSVKDAPARTFFMGLVQGTPYNMIVSPDVKGTITLDLKNVTVAEAMEAARDMYGYEYQRTQYGFEVLPLALQTQIFHVNYLDVKRVGQSQTQLVSTDLTTVGTTTSGSSSSGTTPAPSNNPGTTGGSGVSGSGSQVNTTSQMDFWKDLQATLITLIGDKDGRSVVINPDAGIVVVHAYPVELREVGHYLNNIQNSMQRQVILEAKILEVQLSNSYKAGINWQAIGLVQVGNTAEVMPGGAFSGMLNLTFGGGNFQQMINLLANQGDVQVLSSPRVDTINNQKAVIKVGQDNFFVTSVTSNVTPSSSSATTSSSVGLTPFFAGITLDVTPEISDAGNIILHIHPSVSTVTQQNQTIDLGTQGNITLPLAESTIRESDSIVRAQNGQIVVIGGLMQNATQEQLAETPGISRVPYVGTLFRNTNQLSNRSELVILLRASVVDCDTYTNDIKATNARYQNLDRGFHVGAYPETFGTMAETGH